MTDGQMAASCPQCGSSAAVHSIGELAALARSQLGQAQPGPQPGWAAEPQAGPVPGWAAEPQAGPVPGWAAQPQAGPVPGSWSGRSGGFGDGTVDGLEQAVTDVALGAAARFIGRAVSRRLQRAVSERVLPAVAANNDTLREQVAIAERYPGIRACLTDSVIFLAGGSRVLPMPNISHITLQQADALVAQLQEG